MVECHLSRKLLVCASPQDRRSVGGQGMRWNDLVLCDLRNCNLDEVWMILAEDRNEWRNQIWAATQEVNFKKE